MKRLVLLLGLSSALFAPVAAQQTTPPAPRSAPTAVPARPTDAALTARARTLVTSFYAVKLDPVWAAFTPDARAPWGSLAAFRAYRETGVREYGAESRVLDEEIVRDGDLTYYVRSAVFERQPGQVWAVVLGFDSAGRVAVFTIVLAGEVAPRPPTQT